MVNHSGYRRGAGRKRKSHKLVGEIAAAEERLADRLPRLIDFMLELAEGVGARGSGEGGTPPSFARPPDRRALIYLIDRIMGRPKERVETIGLTVEHHHPPESFRAVLARCYADTPAHPRTVGTNGATGESRPDASP